MTHLEQATGKKVVYRFQVLADMGLRPLPNKLQQRERSRHVGRIVSYLSERAGHNRARPNNGIRINYHGVRNAPALIAHYSPIGNR